MKKNYFLIVTSLVLLNLYGCKKSGESPATASIVGKWLNNKTEFKVYNLNNTLAKDTIITNTLPSGEGNFRTFDANGNFYFTSVFHNSSGVLQTDTTFRGTYILSGTSLKLNYTHNTSSPELAVAELKAGNMELIDAYTDIGESFLGLPASNSYNYAAYVYFVKQ